MPAVTIGRGESPIAMPRVTGLWFHRVKNRRLIRFKKAGGAEGPALKDETSAITWLSLLKDKSSMARYPGRIDPVETARVAGHVKTIFHGLDRKLELRGHKEPAQPMQRRIAVTRWEECDKLRLETNLNIWARPWSSSAKENSATEHTSSPTAAAYSHARQRIAEPHPATGATRLRGHFKESSAK